jgi:hypothetical protein
VETWNAAIDAAMDAVGNVVPVRKVGAAVDIARSDALVALLGVRRLSESTGSASSEEPEGIVQRAHVACSHCWCGEHHEEGR